MGWQEFVVGMVGALAWPVAAVATVLMLRRPIRALLDRFSGAEATAVEVSGAGLRLRMEREVSAEADEVLAGVEAAASVGRQGPAYALDGREIEDEALDALHRGSRDLMRSLGQLLVNDLKTLMVESSPDSVLVALEDVGTQPGTGLGGELDEAGRVIELALGAGVVDQGSADMLDQIVHLAFEGEDMPPTSVLVSYIEQSWGLHAALVRRRRRRSDQPGLYRDPASLFRH